MTAHRLNYKAPTSYSVNLTMMIGVAYDQTHAVFAVPVPYGMSITSATIDLTSIGLVDLVTSTNHTGLTVASVGLYRTEGAHVMVNIKISTSTLTTNHPVRFSGSVPTVTLS